MLLFNDGYFVKVPALAGVSIVTSHIFVSTKTGNVFAWKVHEWSTHIVNLADIPWIRDLVV